MFPSVEARTARLHLPGFAYIQVEGLGANRILIAKIGKYCMGYGIEKETGDGGLENTLSHSPYSQSYTHYIPTLIDLSRWRYLKQELQKKGSSLPSAITPS